MKIVAMHKTEARWERGEHPSPELGARVGEFLGELAAKGALLGGDGLRQTALGVRLSFKGGVCRRQHGPWVGTNELPARLTIVKVRDLEGAVAWATRYADALGDVDLDLRPVTEAWDIGFAPPPAVVESVRVMVIQQADASSERGLTRGDRVRLAKLFEESMRDGVLLADHPLAPSAQGRRVTRHGDGFRTVDGPFTESKELIAGYGMFEAASLDEAAELTRRYLAAIDAHEADVRVLAA